MKLLLQSVVFAVVALLAVPPALANAICITPQSEPEAMKCCSVDHVSASDAAAAISQDCNEGCCSVAPQNSPAPVVPDKVKADSNGPDATVAVSSRMVDGPREIALLRVNAISRTAQDLPVLLHTFRI